MQTRNVAIIKCVEYLHIALSEPQNDVLSSDTFMTLSLPPYPSAQP